MSAIFSAWTVSNITNMDARALTLGFLTSVGKYRTLYSHKEGLFKLIVSVGNTAGLVSSNVFFGREAPRYMTALMLNCIFAGLAMILSLGYTLWMRAENRRRDQAQETVSFDHYQTAGVGDTTDPNFRFQP